MSLITDPAIIGPGAWYIIHLKAKFAVTKSKKDDFIEFMDILSVEFPCKKCRNHIRKYIDSHPIKDFYNLKNNDGEEIGMFKWSWMFHNAVNTRLGKPYVDWDTAWNMYDSDDNHVCNQSCDEDETDEEVTKVSMVQRSPHGKIDRDKIIQGYFMATGIPKALGMH